MHRVAPLLAFLATFAVGPATARASVSFPRFNELAQTIGVTSPDVRCDTLDEWANDPHRTDSFGRQVFAYVAEFGTPNAHALLSPRICVGMLWLEHDPGDATTSSVNRLGRDTVLGEETRAVFVLAHESQHLRGIRDETDADCAALAALPGLLATVGVPQSRAARMLDGARLLHLTAPAEYQTHPC